MHNSYRIGRKNASDKGSSLFVMAFDNSNVKPETPRCDSEGDRCIHITYRERVRENDTGRKSVG